MTRLHTDVILAAPSASSDLFADASAFCFLLRCFAKIRLAIRSSRSTEAATVIPIMPALLRPLPPEVVTRSADIWLKLAFLMFLSWDAALALALSFLISFVTISMYFWYSALRREGRGGSICNGCVLSCQGSSGNLMQCNQHQLRLFIISATTAFMTCTVPTCITSAVGSLTGMGSMKDKMFGYYAMTNTCRNGERVGCALTCWTATSHG